jgi:hypothetical protein
MDREEQYAVGALQLHTKGKTILWCSVQGPDNTRVITTVADWYRKVWREGIVDLSLIIMTPTGWVSFKAYESWETWEFTEIPVHP